MRALVTPNTACRAFPGGPKECTDPRERPGGTVMNKGDVAWAGGSAGPDFFIAMNRIGGFGGTHTAPTAGRRREEGGCGASACRCTSVPREAPGCSPAHPGDSVATSSSFP